jgi:hypothetical protein
MLVYSSMLPRLAPRLGRAGICLGRGLVVKRDMRRSRISAKRLVLRLNRPRMSLWDRPRKPLV